jgi:hypothetical protein
MAERVRHYQKSRVVAHFIEKPLEISVVIAFIETAKAGAHDLPPLYATLKRDVLAG